MAAEPNRNMEGIRFLDETPVPPTPVEPPPQASASRRRRREWPVGLLSFLVVVGTGIGVKLLNPMPSEFRTSDSIQMRFKVGPTPRVEVEAPDGRVRVDRGDGDEVSCRVETQGLGPSLEDAQRALRLLRRSITCENGVVRVLVHGPDGIESFPGRAEIHLEVPRGAHLRIASRNGPVRVEDVTGSIAVRTTNGSIKVEDAGGLLALTSTNGAIDCEAEDAQIMASTANGSIRFEGSLAAGPSRMTSGNGAITLRLDEDDSDRYWIDANATNGHVASDFPIRPVFDDGLIDLSGSAGELIPRIQLRTTNGAIRVERD